MGPAPGIYAHDTLLPRPAHPGVRPATRFIRRSLSAKCRVGENQADYDSDVFGICNIACTSLFQVWCAHDVFPRQVRKLLTICILVRWRGSWPLPVRVSCRHWAGPGPEEARRWPGARWSPRRDAMAGTVADPARRPAIACRRRTTGVLLGCPVRAAGPGRWRKVPVHRLLTLRTPARYSPQHQFIY
jgi:hypothetical protein